MTLHLGHVSPLTMGMRGGGGWKGAGGILGNLPLDIPRHTGASYTPISPITHNE